MASNTYVALSTVTASAASTVSFTSIPATYTDLRIVAVGISSTAGSSVNNWRMTFNGDSTSGLYSNTALYGNGSSAASNRDTNGNFMYLGLVGQASNTAQPVSTFDIMNYSNNTTNKTVLSRGSSASDSTYAMVGLWRNTAAINRVDLFMSGATVTGTFTIYGIAAASAGAKATGGTIYQDDLYFYHVFRSSGTFSLSQPLTADVLTIAGGGGGGSAAGGGGGGGGLCWQSGRSITSGSYTVTVGAGGAGSTGDGGSGSNGGNSVFSTITALGGGGGHHVNSGLSGGSGGGAGYGSGYVGGSKTQFDSGGATGYGNVGGNNNRTGSGSPYPSAGGGGAGGQGGNNTEAAGGVGGVGLTYTTIPALDSFGLVTGTGEIVNGHYYFAGGGGGSRDLSISLGGYGGGGRGGTVISGGVTLAPYAGAVNTGGGGGGGIASGTYNQGGNVGVPGGSGLVIVRYAK